MSDSASTSPNRPRALSQTQSSTPLDANVKPSSWRRSCAGNWRVAATFLVTGIVSLAIRLLNLPVNRVIEARYCKQYYLSHDPAAIDPNGEVPEGLCKIRAVQEPLVWLENAIFIALTVCDIIAAIPLGSVSDRFGRRPIIALNIMATIALFGWFVIVGKNEAIPIEAMLLAPFTSLFGGSDCVYQSVILASLSDAAPDTETRTKYFSVVSSLSYVFSLLGPVLASATMSANIWLPFYFGLALLTCALPLTAFLADKQAVSGTYLTTPAPFNGNSTETTHLLDHGVSEDATVKPEPTLSIVSRINLALRETVRFVMGKGNFQQILIIILLLGLSKSSMENLVLYLSKRYNKTFAEVGYLLSVKAAVNIVLLLLIMPALLSVWLKKHPGLQITADFLGSQLSLAFLCLGTLCLGFATHLWMAILAIVLYGFGTAATIFILSLVKSSVVAPEYESASGRDLSIIVIIQTIGTLAGTPLFAALWVLGLKSDGFMLGLPYFTAALLNAVVLALVVNLHRRWRNQILTGSRQADEPRPASPEHI